MWDEIGMTVMGMDSSICDWQFTYLLYDSDRYLTII